MRLLLTISCFLLLCGNVNAQQTQPRENELGACLAYADYLNRNDRATMKNQDFVQKYGSRIPKIMDDLRPCMKGKAGTSEDVKNCSSSTLSKADFDFFSGFNLARYGIRVSEPNMAEIQSKYRTTCGSVIY